MIINLTYPDKKTARSIEQVVGPAFSFVKRIKMKGIGCAKMQIIEASPEIQKLISQNADTAFCNMELRESGLIVGFNSTGRIYGWCIPYHQLHIYCNGGKLKVYGPKHNLKAIPPFNGNVDKKFLRKVLRLKGEAREDPWDG